MLVPHSQRIQFSLYECPLGIWFKSVPGDLNVQPGVRPTILGVRHSQHLDLWSYKCKSTLWGQYDRIY